MSPFDKCRRNTRAREVQATGYYPYFVPIEASYDTEVVVRGERKVMVGSNNYLGLAHHPRVRKATRKAPWRSLADREARRASPIVC